VFFLGAGERVCLASSRDAAHDRKICGHSRKALLLELFKEIRKNRLLQKLAAEYEDLLKGTCIREGYVYRRHPFTGQFMC
jgi:hypothetical protein